MNRCSRVLTPSCRGSTVKALPDRAAVRRGVPRHAARARNHLRSSPLRNLPTALEPAEPASRPMNTLLPAAIDFQGEARRIDERRPPWFARGTLYVLVAVVISAVTFGAIARIDRIVVAPGKLVTTSSTIVVQPLE